MCSMRPHADNRATWALQAADGEWLAGERVNLPFHPLLSKLVVISAAGEIVTDQVAAWHLR